MDGGTRKGYAKLTSKNHIWNGLRTPWRRSFTLHFSTFAIYQTLHWLGVINSCINFPNVVKNYIFWQNSISLIWLLLSPKYDWRKVEFNLDHFRQSGFICFILESRNLFTTIEITTSKCLHNYEWVLQRVCADQSPTNNPWLKGL